MKFVLTTSAWSYGPDQAEHVKELASIGFTFDDGDEFGRRHKTNHPEIEIKTPEELMKLVERFGEIVVDYAYDDAGKPTIPELEIYDDYRE